MAQPSKSSAKKKLRVLVIDEDPEGGRLVRLGLSGTGCQVMTSTRPNEGPRLVQQHGPDLVLLDVRLSEPGSLETAAKILHSAEDKGTVLVMLSDEESISQRFRAIQMGALDFVYKPSDPAQLNKRLRIILAKIPGASPKPARGPGIKPLNEALTDVERKAYTGIIAFKRPGMNASINFAFGEVQLAECGSARGDDALNEIARHGDWNHELVEKSSHEARQKRPTTRDKPRPFKDVLTVLEKSAPTAKPKPPPGLDPMDSGIDAVLEPEPALDGMAAVADDQPTVVESDPRQLAEDMMAMAPVTKEDALSKAATDRETDEVSPVDTDEVPPVDTGELPDLFTGEYDEEAPTLLVDEPTPDITGEGLSKGMMEQMARDRGGTGDQAREPSTPGHSTTFPADLDLPPAVMEPADREHLREYLVRLVRRPLALAVKIKEVRDALQRAAESLGFSVVIAESGQDAWNITHQQRPVALLSDLHLGDVDGRELLAAIRSDFVVRETPFLILSGEDLARQLKTEGQGAITPILNGLESVLGPRARLYKTLQAAGQEPIAGWVELVGACNMLRTFSAAKLSGRLLIRFGEVRNAEVVFQRGEICAATVNAPQLSVGPLAMLHLLGLEWKEFYFIPDEGGRSRVPLGELEQLVEAASQQNATLMSGLYQYGVKLADVVIDNSSMNSYLQSLPTSSLDVLIRLSEGEPPGDLIQDGIGAPGQLKSILFDMRRKGVIKPTSLKPLRSENDTPVPAQAPVEEAQPTPAIPQNYQRSGPPRWVVVLVAGAVTVILAAGGYLLYQNFLVP